jgi:2-C-methyl-D-erythritol 4-phosphate cytidylyltransferase
MNKPQRCSAILLAGGSGSRMHSHIPKQYLLLGQKPLAIHSFETLLTHPDICELVVVCEEPYFLLFESSADKILGHQVSVRFAPPGQRRQDSVENGLKMVAKSNLVCIHDAARPFITHSLLDRVLHAAETHGAAATAMPLKFTIKETDAHAFVLRTPDRSKFHEIQTPQALHKDILLQGFSEANRQKLTVTDDVSLAELAGKPVKIVQGSPYNLKVTTPDDLQFASVILSNKLYG